MQVHLKTSVKENYRRVFDAFDQKLFLELSPPYPRLKLLRFDGSKVGDVVEVELQTGVSRHRWTSLITARAVTDAEAYFIDEGQELPSPLKQWHHRHLVSKNGSGAVIHDIINYSTGSRMLDLVLYPLLIAQFSMRKPIYKRIFSKGSDKE